MDLLFKREQTRRNASRVNFKLWAKLEPTTDEMALIKRYSFDEAILIGADDTHLLRGAVKIGAIVFVVAALLFTYMAGGTAGIVGGLAAGVGAGYWHINEKRETIFVKDLLHGRNFKCESVIELAQKEAWLEQQSAGLRQVMEGAKHWDGAERHLIEPLSKEEARQFLLKIA